MKNIFESRELYERVVSSILEHTTIFDREVKRLLETKKKKK